MARLLHTNLQKPGLKRYVKVRIVHILQCSFPLTEIPDVLKVYSSLTLFSGVQLQYISNQFDFFKGLKIPDFEIMMQTPPYHYPAIFQCCLCQKARNRFCKSTSLEAFHAFTQKKRVMNLSFLDYTRQIQCLQSEVLSVINTFQKVF